MFNRIKFLLAAFDRLEFCEAGLSARLGVYVERSAAPLQPSRALTVNGIAPLAWREG
jgi:hypothetical protein